MPSEPEFSSLWYTYESLVVAERTSHQNFSCLSLSVHFNGHFSRWTWVSWHHHVSILDLIGAKDDGGGGDNWSYKMCKLQSITTNKPVSSFLQAVNEPGH